MKLKSLKYIHSRMIGKTATFLSTHEALLSFIVTV